MASITPCLVTTSKIAPSPVIPKSSRVFFGRAAATIAAGEIKGLVDLLRVDWLDNCEAIVAMQSAVAVVIPAGLPETCGRSRCEFVAGNLAVWKTKPSILCCHRLGRRW